MPSRHALLAIAASVALAAAPTSSAAGDKVGPGTCKACHPAAYEAWKNGPHAQARESLGERHARDARCLSCHSPDAEEGLAGVTCEACHGPGRLYAASYVMRDPELARALGLATPDARRCAGCHTDSTPSLVRFDFARKLPLIRHWEEKAAPAAPAPSRPPPRPPPPAAPPRTR